MQHITTIGLDLAKRVFQVHGMDHEGRTGLRKEAGYMRANLIRYIRPLALAYSGASIQTIPAMVLLDLKCFYLHM